MNRMKPWLMSGALVVGAGVGGVGTAVTPAASVPESSSWLSNYDTAKAIARQSGKPIFLVFR